jgi:hypothetical protein
MRAVIFASASGVTSGASAQRQNESPSRHYVQFDRNHSGALPRRWRDHCPGNRRGWHVEVIYLAWPASEFPCSRVAGRFAGGPGGERPARGRRTAGPARTGLSRTGPARPVNPRGSRNAAAVRCAGLRPSALGLVSSLGFPLLTAASRAFRICCTTPAACSYSRRTRWRPASTTTGHRGSRRLGGRTR